MQLETNFSMSPPPWDLKGRGFMFIFHFDADWAQKSHFLPLEDHGQYCGGLGALMLVDYQSSNVGPYQELLFIPGKFSWQKKKHHAISRIWVSTQESVTCGRANWGIPKNIAKFTVENLGNRSERWTVSTNEGKSFFCADLSYNYVTLPVHTKILPFDLLQNWQGKRFLTKFFGFGMGRFAKIQSLSIDPQIFPNISNKKPLIGMQIEPLRLKFPRPHMIPEPAVASLESLPQLEGQPPL